MYKQLVLTQLLSRLGYTIILYDRTYCNERHQFLPLMYPKEEHLSWTRTNGSQISSSTKRWRNCEHLLFSPLPNSSTSLGRSQVSHNSIWISTRRPQCSERSSEFQLRAGTGSEGGTEEFVQRCTMSVEGYQKVQKGYYEIRWMMLPSAVKDAYLTLIYFGLSPNQYSWGIDPRLTRGH